jgi:tRNA(Ile)-lysidine synthase
MGILERVLKKIKEENLLVGGEKLVIAFSGGPDSVFLLEMLIQLKKIYNFDFVLAHINHLLRGEESDGDEEFVRKLGEKLEIPVFIKRADINKISKERGIGLEEAGREVRYEFFDEILEKINGDKVVLAHNKDDQIETFLFRLIRGTSIEGLEGISWKREKYIRPILDIYKKEIMDYLNSNGIPYKVDSTNLESDYTRNSIRLELIPFIEKRYNTNFKEKIFSLIEEIRDVNNLLSVDYKEYMIGQTLDEKRLLEEEKFIQKKILTHFLNSYSISVSRNKIEAIVNILGSGGTKKISLDKIYTLKKEYGKISVERNEKNCGENFEELELKVPGQIVFGDYLLKAEISEISNGNYEFSTNLKEGDLLQVRTKRDGDRIIPVGMKNLKKIKDIFINEKIPREEREKVPIVVKDNKIVWIAGVRGSEDFKNNHKEKFVRLSVRRKSE